MTEQHSAPRGRPRSFDSKKVLRLIQQAFWKKGYAATSLDDLVEATGLTRPSLYAAYGNKNDMYIAALESFAEVMAEATVPALFAFDNLESALRAFYAGALNVYFGSKKQSLGCMVFTSAIGEASANPQIRKTVSGFLQNLDDALCQGIAHHHPELAPERCSALAQLAAGGLMNIATRARAGARRPELDRLAEVTAEFIAQSCESSSVR